MPPKTQKYKEVAKSKIDKIASSGAFLSEEALNESTIRKFFIFRWRGDCIEGILGHPITNLRRNTSYPIELDDGDVIEIFGNKLLHDIIRDNELIGSRVKIVYIGKQTGPWGRPRKIYRAYKVKPTVTDSTKEVKSEKHNYINPNRIIKEK